MSLFGLGIRVMLDSQNELESGSFASIFWQRLWRLILFSPELFGRIQQWKHLGLVLYLYFLKVINNWISLRDIVQSSYLLFSMSFASFVFQGIGTFHLSDKICGHRVIYSIPLIVYGLSSYDSSFISGIGNFVFFSFSWLAWLVFYKFYMFLQRTSFCACFYFCFSQPSNSSLLSLIFYLYIFSSFIFWLYNEW